MKKIIMAAGVVLLGTAAYVLTLRTRQLRWGASPGEVSARLAGDDLLPDANLTATRAITIHTSPKEIWPWIVQLGQGRGGFYSYDALENLVGCDIHSADRIVDEWQVIKAGDAVKLAPPVALQVAAVEPGRVLILRGGVAMGGQPPPYDFSWAFVLQPQSVDRTRLIVRERYGYTRRWSALLAEPVEVLSFLMTQQMLRGIKRRAEKYAGSSQFSTGEASPALQK